MAAGGVVMHWLEESHIGFDKSVMRVPIVPVEELFDLRIGRADICPDTTPDTALSKVFIVCQTCNNWEVVKYG